MIIDDLSRPAPQATNGASWRPITDQVMGGVSRCTLTREEVAGRAAVRMHGEVRLENNGGFVQIAIDLAANGRSVDASGFVGVELDVLGNGEQYNLHLRTDDIVHPWQSYRQSFTTIGNWQTVRLPFAAFQPHRIAVPLDLHRLRRIGVVAIGREFFADIACARMELYR